jgi:hypothetical protein
MRDVNIRTTNRGRSAVTSGARELVVAIREKHRLCRVFLDTFQRAKFKQKYGAAHPPLPAPLSSAVSTVVPALDASPGCG